MLPSILKNLVILLILGTIIYVATEYFPALRNQASNQVSQVLGIQTTPTEKNPLATSLTKDATDHVEEVKEKALDINLRDVLSTIERLNKIPNDLTSLSHEIIKRTYTLFRSE